MLYEHTDEDGKIDERVETVYDSPNDQRLDELAANNESGWNKVDTWTTGEKRQAPPPPDQPPPAGRAPTPTADAKGGDAK